MKLVSYGCLVLGLAGVTVLVACPGRTPPSSPAPTHADAEATSMDAEVLPTAPAHAIDFDAASTTIDAEAERVVGEVVCRLFHGCDGGPNCAAPRACVSCFRQTGKIEDCSDLFLRQACQSRGEGQRSVVYLRVMRECERVYRTPSKWPSVP